MPGLIQKSGYIKPGNGGSHYAEYIATRANGEISFEDTVRYQKGAE